MILFNLGEWYFLSLVFTQFWKGKEVFFGLRVTSSCSLYFAVAASRLLRYKKLKFWCLYLFNSWFYSNPIFIIPGFEKVKMFFLVCEWLLLAAYTFAVAASRLLRYVWNTEILMLLSFYWLILEQPHFYYTRF
jgi:hypothetical protein